MEIFFYQAECGDAARIRFYDNNNKSKNILIDSGYERTFNHVLKREIKELIKNKERFDICIVSHIHDDHIGGVTKYIKTINSGELEDIVDTWFYNPPRDYKTLRTDKQEELISSPASISQGDDLYNYINSKGKSLDYDITNKLKQISLGDLKISVLSPTKRKLESLRKKYKSKYTFLEPIEDESISEAVSVRDFDYVTKVEDFNLEEWEEDRSIENGSSITILTEYKNKKVLWLADSHPSDIVKSLKELGYSKENKVVCDWVKVSHHGSAGNSSNNLYDLIDCTNFLISANGENRHFLPTKESIVRIILNKNRNFKKKYMFYFTYDNSTLRKIFKVDGSGVFSKWNFDIIYNSNKTLKISL
jgi:beta-lactamase superfamily II metal-dependent hydrolase